MILNSKTNRIFVIAEAGVNHNGSLKRAKKMIDVAKNCGADAIKFQYFNTSLMAKENSRKTRYQTINTDKNENQYKMLKKLELNENDFKDLKKYANNKKITFLCSAFDLKSLSFLTNKLKEKIIKIPSGEITNYFLLKKLDLNTNKIILSTGMSNIKEIINAINLISKTKIYILKNNKAVVINNKKLKKIKDRLFLLHCISDYPVSEKFVNLLCIKKLQEYFRLNIGYSDHTEGIIAPLAAAAYGSIIIEKHFTLNKKLKGPDHRMSLNPKNLREMISLIRRYERMVGDGDKSVSHCELKNIKFVRKSLIASKKINKGEKFTLKNLSAKRPGTGINPMMINKILNKKSKKKYLQNSIIDYKY